MHLAACRPEECGGPSEDHPVASERKGKHGKRGCSKLGAGETPDRQGYHRADKGKGKPRSVSLGTVSQQAEDNGHLADSSLAASNPESSRKRGKRRHVAENRTAVVGHISSKRLKAYGVTVGTAIKKGKIVRGQKRTT